jgi:protein Tex
VKIDPRSIGVGQYQHDLAESKLARSLDAVVEDCVNGVGVDVNTASVPLLRRVSGITETLASHIVGHREANGPFRDRTALKQVPRLGAKAFEQSAGFLRVPGGDDPLDASGVHPESYPVVRRMIGAAGCGVKELIGNTAALGRLKPQDFVNDAFGLPTVSDILAELEKPGRDPRPAFRTARFSDGVERIVDLRPGMVLEGVVTNVAAFGAFVDVGVHQDGLVHVSAMSRKFVSDPREVAKPGDIVKVKVLDVDEPRKRISLTLRLDDELPRKPSAAEGRPGSDARPGSDRRPGSDPNDSRGRDGGKASPDTALARSIRPWANASSTHGCRTSGDRASPTRNPAVAEGRQGSREKLRATREPIRGTTAYPPRTSTHADASRPRPPPLQEDPP